MLRDIRVHRGPVPGQHGTTLFFFLTRNQWQHQGPPKLIKTFSDLQRLEPSEVVRPAYSPQKHVSCNMWLAHNMGGIGCCLLRNVYAAVRHDGEILHHMENWVQINWLQAAASQRGLIKHKTQMNLNVIMPNCVTVSKAGSCSSPPNTYFSLVCENQKSLTVM